METERVKDIRAGSKILHIDEEILLANTMIMLSLIDGDLCQVAHLLL